MAKPTGDKFRLRFIENSIASAKAAGTSKEDFQSEFALELKKFDTDRGQRKDLSFIENFALSIASPFKKTAQNIGALGAEFAAVPQRRKIQATEAERTKIFQQATNLAQQAQEATDPAERQMLLQQSRELAESAPEATEVSGLARGAGLFKSESELQQIGEDPTKALFEQGIKPSAGVAAFALPAKLPLAGAGVVARGAAQGALAGGLTGLAQTPEQATPLETLQQVGIGTGVGAAAGAVTAKVSSAISKKVNTIKAARAQKKAVLRHMHELSKSRDPFIKPSDLDIPSWSDENFIKRTGTKLVGTQTKVPAGLGRSVDAPEAFRKMSDYGFTNADYWDDAAGFVTGKKGIVTKMTQNAVGNADDISTTGLLSMSDELIQEEPLIIPANHSI